MCSVRAHDVKFMKVRVSGLSCVQNIVTALWCAWKKCIFAY